jgi:abortive infection bacteriophage resistance protein
MRHLRDNGIAISGSSQKQQLINTGYFHGYKGYRFFVSSSNQLPFTSYNEIYSTIQYDTKLKSLLYGKMMFIETALKNIALNTIMAEIGPSSIYDMYDKVVSSYKNAPSNIPNDIKKKYQNNKLNLQGSIQNSIAAAYRKDNPKITHFYNNVNYNEVPIWAIFEILTMGDFGYLLSCLTIDMREKISLAIGINLSCDTYRELVYKYVYALKDLRNAIAHNDVVYDTRFRKMDPSRPMKQCLILEMGLPYMNFKTIVDYIILICYYLKLLKVSKTEIKALIREFEKITNEYQSSVNPSVSAVTIHPDLSSRITILKNSI